MQNINKNQKISLKAAKSAFLASLMCPNVNECPKLKGIFINVNLDSEINNDFYSKRLQADLNLLCNQKATYSLSKKVNSKKGTDTSFKLRIRKKNMLFFFKNIIFFALKNLRDFDGFRIKSFDSQGNYTFSNLNRLAFSEIEFDERFRDEKFNITFHIFSKNTNHSFLFLKILEFPFKINKTPQND